MNQNNNAEKVDVNKLPPVISLDNTIEFITKRLPQLSLNYDQGVVYNDFFRRVMIKRISNVTGDLEGIKNWKEDTIDKELNEIKNLKKNIKKNKKNITKKSKEVYDKAKEDSEIIKKGTELKIKYMYLKASEGEINIPHNDAVLIKNAQRLMDTFDIKKARNAKRDAYNMAVKVINQKNEPQGTEANIDTNVETGANTSAYFGATLGKRLERFESTSKHKLSFILIPIVILILFYLYKEFN